MTAMYDAIGNTIDSVYNKWKDSKDKSDKVIFLIMTDGQENCSKEYNQKTVFELIQKRKDDDKWAFLFIGANIDTMQAGGGMGISAGNTMSYTGTQFGVNTAYNNMSRSVSKMRMSSTVELSTKGFADTLLSDNGAEKEKN
jgi:hypothetical protein